MIIEQATVIAYQNGMATVECQLKSGCGSCAAQQGCGTRSLSALLGDKPRPQFTLKVDQPLVKGDRVELGLTEQRLLTGVFWLYAVPLLAMVGSSLLFSRWIANELVVAVIVVCCTLFSFKCVKKRLAQYSQEEFTPVFLRKI